MDCIFDIDGTLADASHRLHFIKDPTFFVAGGVTRDMKPDWDSFLSSEQIAKDMPIAQTWATMDALLETGHRVLFITGRPERQRETTWKWLNEPACEIRSPINQWFDLNYGRLFMRKDGDRRPSSVVKRDLLAQARHDGLDPVMAFEDRADDTAMWRSEGLLCCQVAEGKY